MNVLIFVMTMLMLLSLMTYSRLDSYISSQAYQSVFKHYMEQNERGAVNSQATDIYKKIRITEKDKNEKSEENSRESKPEKKKIVANSKISLSLLFDSNRRDKEKEWQQTKILLKNLMKNLYSKQPFYIKMEKQNPGFVDDLLNAVVAAIDHLPKEKKPKDAKDLGNLKLNDPKLDKILYKMLNGAISLDKPKQKNGANGDKSKENENTSESDNGNGTDEYKSPEGYYSLLDYVTAKGPLPIRVYLAPKNVLLSIFSENTVDNIIAERNLLHKQAKSGSDFDQLSESFKNQFLNARDPGISEEMLNFQVNKSNPA